MDASLQGNRNILYARLVPSLLESENADILTGLFTRPPPLALTDELRHGLPVWALNRACTLLRKKPSPVAGNLSIEMIALELGFQDVRSFENLFYRATGWYPAEWHKEYGG